MQATMAGIITSKKNLITKNNKMMAFVDMEDLYGTVEVVVFPNIYERFGSLVAEDSIVSVTGSINFKEGEVPKLLAEKIVDLRSLTEELEQSRESVQTADAESVPDAPEGLIKIKLPSGNATEMLNRIRNVMLAHRGKYQAIIYMPQGGSFRTERELWVQPDADFRKAVTDIVGEENYKG